MKTKKMNLPPIPVDAEAYFQLMTFLQDFFCDTLPVDIRPACFVSLAEDLGMNAFLSHEEQFGPKRRKKKKASARHLTPAKRKKSESAKIKK